MQIKMQQYSLAKRKIIIFLNGCVLKYIFPSPRRNFENHPTPLFLLYLFTDCNSERKCNASAP